MTIARVDASHGSDLPTEQRTVRPVDILVVDDDPKTLKALKATLAEPARTSSPPAPAPRRSCERSIATSR
jgi:hypothetical protein